MTTDILLTAGNLPAEPNSFVGRERDLAELGTLLGEVRALTLCGPGGIGKTRLALRLAAELAPDYPDGAWVAELADVTDPELVPRRVAATLGIREEPDRELADTLADTLRSRRLLLIMDTCEHLVDACAPLVQQLLASCRQLRIMATSREPLRVRGETVWRVPPLELPAAPDKLSPDELLEHEAIRLFADRAAAVRPGFKLESGNAEAVTRLVRMLDGIPLAIELAAARIRALSVEQVAGRLSDRFGLLAAGDRTAPVRQQTLRAAVDWSYELLTEPEQALLRRLSVFAGWNLEMAEQVGAGPLVPAGRVLDLLAALIDKSLVSLDGEQAGDARYRLLDTIREYAAGQLEATGEAPAVRAAHRDYLLGLGEGIVARAFVRGDPPWPVRVEMYQRIDIERPNFLAALAECLHRGDLLPGLRLCIALRSPWVAYGNVAEGVGWFDRFLDLARAAPEGTVPDELLARALVHRSELAFEQTDFEAAGGFARAGLDKLGSAAEPGGPSALRILSLASLQAGRPDDALDSVDAAVEAARAAGDVWEEGLGQTARAVIITRLGRPAEAQAAFESALDTLRDNNGWGIAQAQYGFGTLARQRGDAAGALRHFRAALALYREIDARPEIARCLAGIGWVALGGGDLELAAASLTESIQVSLATGQRLAIARGIDAFAALAVLEEDLPRATRLAGAGAALRAAAGHGPPGGGARVQALLEPVRQQLGATVTDDLLAQGAQLSSYDAVAYALSVPDSPGAGTVAAPPVTPVAPAAPAAGHTRPGSLPGLNASPVLTTRELEIARLIARGLSNRGIAAELTISPATAARHVANIFGKLGFTSRTQVAAWIAEQKPGEQQP
jgi:predicted ATPase/DNA-binding CsgD family transcriptional regulator